MIAMVGYHAAWDLSWLQLIRTAVVGDPVWNGVARTIAATFLVLAGIGLALAHGRGIRPAAFARRLGTVAAGAASVSLGTWLVFPDAWVFFGILHNMVASSVLALPATRLPPAVTAGTAAAALTAPLWLTSPALDAPAFMLLGLGAHPPVTNDWVPLLPWTGFVLAGVAAGRALVDRPDAIRRFGALPAPGGLAWLGRHSLVVYLVHQPILFGSLTLLLRLTGPDPTAEARPFLDGCAVSCRQAGGSIAACLSACACTADALKRDGLWSPALSGAASPEDGRRIGQHARACLATQNPVGKTAE